MKTTSSKFGRVPVGCLVFIDYVGWCVKVSRRSAWFEHRRYSPAYNDVVTILE